LTGRRDAGCAEFGEVQLPIEMPLRLPIADAAH
jgi:hypothetical protein